MAYIEKQGRRWRVRYPRADGSIGSLSGFRTRKAALAYARDFDTDRRRGLWLDPKAGRMPLAQWAATWFDSIDVAPATEAQYRSLTRNHIIPCWGATALADITGISVRIWAKQIRSGGYAPSTVSTIIKIMSMMLDDAAEEHLIPANPLQYRRHRGRRTLTRRTEPVVATPCQVAGAAEHARILGGDTAAALIITAAYTGARWGELAGLQRVNTLLDDGYILIDPDIGALHEINGTLQLGPPKTAESARTITLPEFLIDLLRRHLAATGHAFVFTTARGSLIRRSNFDRRIMRPACDGTTTTNTPLAPIAPGLTFQGLRHSHKTWLISDGIPEVAQARRLGHRLGDKIQDAYSHVAPDIEQRLLASLQHHWQTSTTPATSGQNFPSDRNGVRLLRDPLPRRKTHHDHGR